MPTFNASATIDTAIRSILVQTFTEFEFLIVDDGSTDDTCERVREYHDPRLRLLKCPHRGLTETLNEGLRQARGEWIARIDADDIAVTDRLERQLQAAAAHAADVIGCWYAVFSGYSVRYLVRVKETHDDLRERLRLQNDIVHPGVLFRKAAILSVGGYQGGIFEDYDLWLRLRDRVRFYAVPEVLTLLRYSVQSYSRKDGASSYALVGDLLKRHSESLDHNDPNNHTLLGWREYFYGDPAEARRHWRRVRARALMDYRIMIAFLFSYFPENIRTLLKEARLRQRLEYYLAYWSSPARHARHALRVALQQAEAPR